MLFHLWLNEWKRVIQSPVLILFALFLPVAIIAVAFFVLVSVIDSDFETVDIVIVDEDQTIETQTLIQQLETDETIAEQINFIHKDAPVEPYLNDPGDEAAIIFIPEFFTESLRTGEGDSISVYLNDHVPFGAQLAEVFLESGQSYISSAQAGVNTVHHFYSRELEGDERQEVLQQNTIHFTLFALNRNALFEIEEGVFQDVLSWRNHFTIAGMLFLYVSSFLLLISFYRPKTQPIIQERLQLIDVTQKKQRLARFLFHFSFSVLYLAALNLSVYYFVPRLDLVDFAFVIHWLILALCVSTLFMVSDAWVKQEALKWFVSTHVLFLLLFVSGLVIPPIYLPNAFSPFLGFYTGFVSIINDGALPWFEWSVLFLIVLILFLLHGLGRKKVVK